jgi:hypothetical protein
MCRFAAPLAFNFIAAIAMPETKMGPGKPVSGTTWGHLAQSDHAAVGCSEALHRPA